MFRLEYTDRKNARKTRPFIVAFVEAKENCNLILEKDEDHSSDSAHFRKVCHWYDFSCDLRIGAKLIGPQYSELVEKISRSALNRQQ